MTNSSNGLPPLNLPAAELKIRSAADGPEVFDPIRNKYVHLTPEEYVRQHYVNYLVSALHYPKAVLANEVGIKLNGLSRRCDTVAFRNGVEPLLIVEYKAPGIAITQKVFDQIARYNMVLRAPYLAVSNGFRHFYCAYDHLRQDYHFIPRLPSYEEIIASSHSIN